MRFGLVQQKAAIGRWKDNLEKHFKAIALANKHSVDFLLFPELSLTGYCTTLAKKNAFQKDHIVFQQLQEHVNQHKVVCLIGLPLTLEKGISIGMAIITPNAPIQFYSKQHLHSDEKPFFIEGKHALKIEADNTTIVPAICYEAMLPKHAEEAASLGANCFASSVAKPANGVSNAHATLAQFASKHQFDVLFANAVGECEGFVCAGRSAVWNAEGKCLGSLDAASEALLLYDNIEETVENIPANWSSTMH